MSTFTESLLSPLLFTYLCGWKNPRGRLHCYSKSRSPIENLFFPYFPFTLLVWFITSKALSVLFLSTFLFPSKTADFSESGFFFSFSTGFSIPIRVRLLCYRIGNRFLNLLCADVLSTFFFFCYLIRWIHVDSSKFNIFHILHFCRLHKKKFYILNFLQFKFSPLSIVKRKL